MNGGHHDLILFAPKNLSKRIKWIQLETLQQATHPSTDQMAWRVSQVWIECPTDQDHKYPKQMEHNDKDKTCQLIYWNLNQVLEMLKKLVKYVP